MVICNPKGVPILILSGEGHMKVIDLFLHCTYQHYYDKINHNETIPVLFEELKIDHMQVESKEQKAAKS
jgi:hypothetical protein